MLIILINNAILYIYNYRNLLEIQIVDVTELISVLILCITIRNKISILFKNKEVQGDYEEMEHVMYIYMYTTARKANHRMK